jgi:hypothetical protein
MSNKKVKFSEKLEFTYLVPKCDVDSISCLWWNSFDIYRANELAWCEIKSLLNRHPFMTHKQALKLLYQPNNISYNKCNFE